MARNAKSKNESTANWIIGITGTIAVGALAYAVTTSWQNADRLADITSDMKSVKASLVRISMKTSPNDPTVPIELLSSAGAKEGLQLFADGKYPAAYSKWTEAAGQGDQMAILAIGASKESLQLRLKDPSIPESQRQVILSGLDAAPMIEFKDGKYVIKAQE